MEISFEVLALPCKRMGVVKAQAKGIIYRFRSTCAKEEECHSKRRIKLSVLVSTPVTPAPPSAFGEG